MRNIWTRNICINKEKNISNDEKWFKHGNWGEILQQNRIFFPDDFLYPKKLAAVQRLSLSARSSAARTVETMPPRKWKQMWWCGWTLRNQWNLAHLTYPVNRPVVGGKSLWFGLFRMKAKWPGPFKRNCCWFFGWSCRKVLAASFCRLLFVGVLFALVANLEMSSHEAWMMMAQWPSILWT